MSTAAWASTDTNLLMQQSHNLLLHLLTLSIKLRLLLRPLPCRLGLRTLTVRLLPVGVGECDGARLLGLQLLHARELLGAQVAHLSTLGLELVAALLHHKLRRGWWGEGGALRGGRRRPRKGQSRSESVSVGQVWVCGEMRGDAGRCGEMRGDAGRWPACQMFEKSAIRNGLKRYESAPARIHASTIFCCSLEEIMITASSSP